MSDSGAKRTPLHDEHERLRARLVVFAGFEMPVHYPAGIVAEHRAVREAVGIFDVSHMGELVITGPEALDLVQLITTNDASSLDVGQAQYSTLCREDGGTLDDCLVYRFDGRWMIVVNAANIDKDREWIRAHGGAFDAVVDDRSDATALIAVQGPDAAALLSPIAAPDPDGIGYYRFAEGEVDGRPAVVSRTGYTGEDGFELYLDPADAAPVWRSLLDAGRGRGVQPCGLGARDSLRLEVGYPLYGNDLDEEHTPVEAGLGWVVKPSKGEFIGREPLARQKEGALARKLAGFVLRERGFPRPGYEIRAEGEPVGEVTSGVHSPTLEKGIGMGYVAAPSAAPGTLVEVVIRGRPVPAEVTRPPFYTEGSIKR